MAEVPGAPYEPYFTAQPTERPVQLRGVDAPSAAFGENIANAIRTFGGDEEKAGNEVFSRAVALRKMQIDGNVRDLTTQYYNEMAPIQADFLTAQGNNASQDALNSHLARMEEVRQKYLGQAGQYGLYGINRFGDEAASLQRSFVREAAVYSGTQTKRAQFAGNSAALDTIKRSWVNYEDEKEVDKKVSDGERIIRQNGMLGPEGEGEDPRTTEDKVIKWKQEVRAAQITGLAWNKPEQAMGLVEAHQTDLGDEYSKVRDAVEKRYETVVGGRLARYASREVQRTGGSVQDGVDALDKAIDADSIASQIPGFKDRAEQQFRSQHRGINYDAVQDTNTASQQILNMINAPGASYRNRADLEAAKPEVKALEEQLAGTKPGAQFLNNLDSLIQHNWNVAHTAQMDANYKYLRGLAASTDPVQRQEFLSASTDLSKYELRKSDWSALMSRRDYIIKHPEEENPILRRAMRIAQVGSNGDILKDLGINKLTDSNSVKYHRMTGGLSIAIDEWMKANEGKVPSDKELDEQIVKPTIREHVTGGLDIAGTHWFGRRRGAFDIDVDKDTLNKFKQDEAERMSKYQPTTPDQITDEEAIGAAQRLIFHDLYAKPTGTK